MSAALALSDRMTVEEFLAFVEARPDGERWELIEGIAIMNASPTDWHQAIIANLTTELMMAKINTSASWTPLLGIGTRVPISPNSLPQPDLFIMEGPMSGQPITSDALVLFEVLSKSNTKADQAWRKRVYASIKNCQHYVTVSARTADVVRYDRADGWKGTKLNGLNATLELPVVSVSVPLSIIYRWTPIA
jgi:Uma2 family endonuclease